METEPSKEEPKVRDFAYAKDDPRHEGTHKEIEAEEEGDAGNESDPWSSFEGGGPDMQIDDDSGSGATTILRKARAMYDFEAENPTELEFAENDILYITYKQCDGWLVGYKGNQVGLIPENYVELLD
ncbi:HOG (high osmolarity glycerol) pathway protein [Coemansia spiralis]|uniref:HOG (High osmolarity glycerol) pathway protein n=2 Tax=Coemansia TaxID=4863 RepID=A0A9W8KXU0_9FUNG|nr:HOG (high osmolarity glycerol) pathway protein [Coemansia umbellata]KAJ2675297.1 HOG (high osmolarity glycerol) pathway protein [Coemansia spiralis]